MKTSTIKGVSFGLTSGIITTLGMMVGLNFSTGSKLVVLGGILTIAIADAFSDALGIHVSEEAEGRHSHQEIWLATLATFLSKLGFALTFVIPVLVFRLPTAVMVSLVWGLLVLGVISYLMGKDQEVKTYKVVMEHLSIALLVIVITYFVGSWIAKYFN
ncbi:MAG TPA: hypothetical protein VJK25_02315 [Patescibacteria group bacterium]|nr:hypothetical protein [Patescibacteria group bacterium]